MGVPHPGSRDVVLVDSTLATGQVAMWGAALNDEDLLTTLAELDAARLDRIEVPSPAVRLRRPTGVFPGDLTTWEWRSDAVTTRTPRRWVGPLDIPGQDEKSGEDVRDVLLRLAAEAGLRELRLGDATNDMHRAREAAAAAATVGVGFVAEVAYVNSPRHDDELFATHTKRLLELAPTRLCLTDPLGVLIPERLASLAEILRNVAPDVPWEFHGRCNNWFGPLNALAAVDAGIAIVHTAVAPLAAAESVPDVQLLARNIRTRGHGVRVDLDTLRRVEPFLRFLADRKSLPIVGPRQYSERRLRNHLSEPVVQALRTRVATEEMGTFDDVLAEFDAVHTDLGYPVVVGPIVDAIIEQAITNVSSGGRYDTVVSGVAAFAAGHLGQPDAVESMDEAVRQRLEQHANAVDHVRDAVRVTALEASDALSVERAVVGEISADALDARRHREARSSSPVTCLVRELSTRPLAHTVKITGDRFALHLQRREDAGRAGIA